MIERWRRDRRLGAEEPQLCLLPEEEGREGLVLRGCKGVLFTGDLKDLLRDR